MAEILFTVSLVSFIVSGVAFVATAFCWFKFKIPQVVGDLSGRTAKKSIERMRAGYEKSGDKSGTGLFSGNMVRGTGAEETCVLAEGQCTEKITGETEPFQKHEVLPASSAGNQLMMLEEIIMLHTDEVIW